MAWLRTERVKNFIKEAESVAECNSVKCSNKSAAN